MFAYLILPSIPVGTAAVHRATGLEGEHPLQRSGRPSILDVFEKVLRRREPETRVQSPEKEKPPALIHEPGETLWDTGGIQFPGMADWGDCGRIVGLIGAVCRLFMDCLWGCLGWGGVWGRIPGGFGPDFLADSAGSIMCELIFRPPIVKSAIFKSGRTHCLIYPIG